MILLTSYASLDPLSWRGTAAIVQWSVGTLQLFLFYLIKHNSSSNSSDKIENSHFFNSLDIITDILMIFSGILGLWLGNMLSSKVNVHWFNQAMIVFLAMSSASMITSLSSSKIQLFSLFFTFIFTILLLIYQNVSDNRRAEEARVRADASFMPIPCIQTDDSDEVIENPIQHESMNNESGTCSSSSTTEVMSQSSIELQTLLET